MMFFLLLLGTLPIILSFLLLPAKNEKNVVPPGPAGLRLIGNLHQFDSSTLHLYFWTLPKKYGKIFSLNLGFANVIVVSSAKFELNLCAKFGFNVRCLSMIQTHD